MIFSIRSRLAGSLPDATSTAQFSGWANANLTSLTERTDDANKSNNGGSLGVATGIKATAGAYGNTTATHASSAVKGMMSIAIKN
jgi:MSHA biogenesis protein MshQ